MPSTIEHQISRARGESASKSLSGRMIYTLTGVLDVMISSGVTSDPSKQRRTSLVVNGYSREVAVSQAEVRNLFSSSRFCSSNDPDRKGRANSGDTAYSFRATSVISKLIRG